jgi:lipid-A-disaccharide synthase
VPQVVCYGMLAGKIIYPLRNQILNVPYISLVNLIAGREIVKELIAAKMTTKNIRQELDTLLHNDTYRQKILNGYENVAQRLGEAGAPYRAAQMIVNLLQK